MRRFTIPSFLLPIFVLLFSACSKDKQCAGPTPNLPSTPYNYSATGKDKLAVISFGEVGIVTITPVVISPPTNMGVNLGHVIFNDNTIVTSKISCGSCHVGPSGVQNIASSVPLNGGSPNNKRQVYEGVRPHPKVGIEDPNDLVNRMLATSYYRQLFKDAYGTSEITPERIADALAQYIAAIADVSDEQMATDPRYTNPFK